MEADSFSEWIGARRDGLANGATQGVAAAGLGAQTELRQAVMAGGLGQRLPNAIGLAVYPRNRPSLGAAAVIYPRGEAAERVLTAFSEGATIVAKGHPYLSIPTENCPRVGVGRGAGSRAMTPQEVEARFNADLHFLPAHRRGVYVLAIRGVPGRNGRGFRPATPGRLHGRSARAVQMIPMFVLVPSVYLRKRFDAVSIVDKWASLAPDLVAAATPEI